MNKLAIQETLTNFSEQFKAWWDAFLSHLPELVLGILILVLSFFLSRLVFRVTLKIAERHVEQKSVGKLITKAVSGIVIFLGLFFALQAMNLGKSVTGLLAGAGISGLILGLALQGTLSNTVSGIVLALRKNLRVGDWVETNDFKGEILKISLNYMVLKESDNNIVILPNKTILENPLKNYAQTSKMKVVLQCGIAYDTDLRKVKKITTDLIEDRFGSDLIEEEPEFFFTEFGSSSINFMCRFWIYGKSGLDRIKSRSDLIIELKELFDREGIHIPFPIRTLQFKNREVLEPTVTI